MLEIGIPVYNAKKTLDRALSSIVAQTERRRVLVTVCDDCSTDGGVEHIIDHYTGLLNIRLISTDKNGGAGACRNKILDEACGEFIMFLDADDALASPLALKKLLHEAYRQMPDMVYGRFIEEGNNYLIEKDLKNNTWLHGKMWRTDFLQRHHIHFPLIRYNEDSAFNAIVLGFNPKTIVIDYPIYCWLNNSESTVRGMDDYYCTGAIDFLRGRIYAYETLSAANHKDAAEKDWCHNLGSIFNIYTNLYYKWPEKAKEYSIELGKFLNKINFTVLLAKSKVKEYIAYQVNNTHLIPRYGMYTYPIGFFEYIENCMKEQH